MSERWDGKPMETPISKRCGVPQRWIDRHSLFRSLPDGGTGANLGVWRGNKAAELLKLARPKRVYLVDAWKPYTPNSCSQKQWDSIHEGVEQRFASDKRVVVYRNSFEMAACFIKGNSLDWIYHDGAKTKTHMLETLYRWWPKLKPGGFWIGQDFVMEKDSCVIQGAISFVRYQGDAMFEGITRVDTNPCYVLRKAQ